MADGFTEIQDLFWCWSREVLECHYTRQDLLILFCHDDPFLSHLEKNYPILSFSPCFFSFLMLIISVALHLPLHCINSCNSRNSDFCFHLKDFCSTTSKNNNTDELIPTVHDCHLDSSFFFFFFCTLSVTDIVGHKYLTFRHQWKLSNFSFDLLLVGDFLPFKNGH